MMKTKIGLLMLLVATVMFTIGNVAQGVIVIKDQTDSDSAEEFLTDYYAGSPGYDLGDGWLGSSDIEVGSDYHPECWTGVGLQFDQLAIPQGSTILNAKLTFVADEDIDPGTLNDLTIFGEAAANAVAWGTTPAMVPFDVTSRARTSASVGWSPTDTLKDEIIDTPDLTGIIQEIVNQGGWSDNNRLSLLIFPDAYLDGLEHMTNTVTGHTYESGGGEAPVLTVEWVPEPATICLLGLGGLMLRRRRKA